MKRLEGRVALVTGAGRGLGRAHALALAAQGAAVVVNDLGASLDGGGQTAQSPALDVVAEIEAAGGRAVADSNDISTWEGARAAVRCAVANYGDVHVVVNNAGILRDRTLASLQQDEWDAVLRVHLTGSAAVTSAAMAWWKQCQEGQDRSVVMTTSASALSGVFGQAAYASAKLGLLALARVTALEGARFGVRANALSPSGRTRMGGDSEVPAELARRADGFDPLDPSNVSPLVAWLAEATCPANNQVLSLVGDRLTVSALPQPLCVLTAGERWTPERLDRELVPHLVEPVDAGVWLGVA